MDLKNGLTKCTYNTILVLKRSFCTRTKWPVNEKINKINIIKLQKKEAKKLSELD